jgi:hypothetical protein
VAATPALLQVALDTLFSQPRCHLTQLRPARLVISVQDHESGGAIRTQEADSQRHPPLQVPAQVFRQEGLVQAEAAPGRVLAGINIRALDAGAGPS